MKKFALSLLASLAIFASGSAAVTNIVDSVNQIDAVTGAIIGQFSNVIPMSQRIVSIVRLGNPCLTDCQIRYLISTVECNDCGCNSRRSRGENFCYIATLQVIPPTDIGANTYNVTSLTCVRCRCEKELKKLRRCRRQCEFR